MTDASNSRPTQSQPPENDGNSTYLVVVAGLLVLIIALLASLWLRERSQRLAAERELVEYRERVERLEATLRPLMIEAAAEPPEE